MEYDDQEEEQEEALDPGYPDSLSHPSSTRPPAKIEAAPLRKPRYKECQKNHAVGIGSHAVDGCREFMPAGEDGTLESLKCAACSCHRNFHRRETDYPAAAAAAVGGGGYPFHHGYPHLVAHHPPHGHFGYRSPAGYLHVAAAQRAVAPLALPSSSGGGGGSREEMEEYYYSNPGGSGGKKRFRTKFTAEQKEKMLDLAERLEWKIQKQDEEAVQEFCSGAGITRHVLKVWMHNNKHTLGKKT